MSVPPCAERREGRPINADHFVGVVGLAACFVPRLACCRALKLPMMPSLSMDTKHRVVRRRDDGVLDMMVPHRQRGNGGH
jgi:hypothetical protein